MSENAQQPTKFEPKIPLWMRPHYDAMPPHEQWKCDMASVQEQQNNWLMEHAVRADEHRAHINKRVDDLATEVKPVVATFKLLATVRAKLMAIALAILIPMALAVFGAWVSSKFQSKPNQTIKAP
jgi:hypothetical protein